MALIYELGATLPDAALTARDDANQVIDLSSGYTLTATVTRLGATTPAFTKAVGITGASTQPNLTVAWATSAELTALTPGNYQLIVNALRASDGKVRKFAFALSVK